MNLNEFVEWIKEQYGDAVSTTFHSLISQSPVTPDPKDWFRLLHEVACAELTPEIGMYGSLLNHNIEAAIPPMLDDFAICGDLAEELLSL